MTIATKYYEPILFMLLFIANAVPFLIFGHLSLIHFVKLNQNSMVYTQQLTPKYTMVILYNANQKQMHLTTIKSDLNKNTLLY